jgi:hypothetical protein
MKWPISAYQRAVRGFFFRLGYAVALGVLVFDLAVLPLGLNLDLWSPILDILNAPVGALSLLIPCPERGLDFPFGHCHHQGGQTAPEFFFSHLRLAVPVYVLCFYLPNLFSAGWGWLTRRRRQRGIGSERPGAGSS